jgi:predicted RNA-binding protein (virulence factor B family)
VTLIVKKQLKIYGTRKRGHRELWIVKGKGVYKEVRRDKKGRIISVKNWSPKNPISKEIFTETQPLIVEYRTGKEGLHKIRDSVREWEWIEMKVES